MNQTYGSTFLGNTVTIGAAAVGSTPSALTQILQQIITTPVAQVVFSSIPQNFNTLMLMFNGLVTDAAAVQNMLVQFNGDTGNNYDYEYNYANVGSSGAPIAAGVSATSSILVPFLVGSTGPPANQQGCMQITIPGYAQVGRLKTFMAQASANTGNIAGNFYSSTSSGNWRNTAAINSIRLFENGAGSFAAGSVFTLYGLT